MAELKALSSCGDLLPLRIGSVQLEEMAQQVLTGITPFDDAGLADALKAAHGMALPKPGRATGKDGARCIWFGRGQAVMMGPAPDAALAEHAAVVDLSDGWAVVTLSGATSEDVLARLVPVDLREAAFKRGHTARTHLGHMSASITRIGVDSFLICVFRSMAATLVHDLKQAMAAVASRG